MMQFLWKYVDDILGKGFSFFAIVEMIFYFTITLIPMALPISILLSSVMVYGNLAEKYELSSMKSAGISLLRIMRPGLMVAIGTFFFSLLASNYLKPQANFNFQSRLKAIQKQKATLVIEEKIFEKDFEDYIIRVDKKDADDRTIHNILIYDHSQVDKSLLNVTRASTGEMYTDSVTGNFVMELYDGHQYTEMKREYKGNGSKKYPLMRTSYGKWRKEFDLSAFSTDDMSSGINKRKEDMLTVAQLNDALDTIDMQKAESRMDMKDIISSMSDVKADKNIKTLGKSDKTVPVLTLIDDIPDTLRTITSLVAPSTELRTIIRDANKNSVSTRERLRSFKSKIGMLDRSAGKYLLRLHQQFSFAMIGIVFLFLGAPLGSIIRKGGFGYPLLYAILFYMLFMMMAIMGEKLIRTDALHPILSAWLPNIVIAPIAIWLTYRALRDKTSLFW